MKNLRAYMKYVNYAVTALILGLLAFSAVDYAQGAQPFFVVSDHPSSMSPKINCGDAVMVYKVPFDKLHVGDIIVFKDPRGNPQTIIHRIAAIEVNGTSRYLITKGDNAATNPTTDPWKVTQGFYLSKVEVIVPAAGYVSPALWGSYAPLVVFGVVLVAIIAFLFWPQNSKAEEENENEETGKGGSSTS